MRYETNKHAMDKQNLFTDYEVLSGFVDKLIAVKYPDYDPASLQEYKNQLITALDRRIVQDVLMRLPDEQVKSIHDRFEKEGIDFASEFQSAGLDLESIMADSITAFGKEVLGEAYHE